MKPFFEIVWRNYPRSEKREPLFDQMGWADIKDHPGYQDTCAIRMSVALTRSGMALPGASMRAKAGTVKDKRIEPRQRDLSNILRRVWGGLPPVQ